MKSSNTGQPATPSIPHTKTNLTPGEWSKRGGSPIYQKRVKRMVALLRSGVKQSKRGVAAQAHYWLDSASITEDRRQRSPSERLADTAKSMKDSVKY